MATVRGRAYGAGMRRAHVDAVTVVVFLVLGSVAANAYTLSVQDDEATQLCEAMLSPGDCPD